jgi:hypothetical protein
MDSPQAVGFGVTDACVANRCACRIFSALFCKGPPLELRLPGSSLGAPSVTTRFAACAGNDRLIFRETSPKTLFQVEDEPRKRLKKTPSTPQESDKVSRTKSRGRSGGHMGGFGGSTWIFDLTLRLRHTPWIFEGRAIEGGGARLRQRDGDGERSEREKEYGEEGMWKCGSREFSSSALVTEHRSNATSHQTHRFSHPIDLRKPNPPDRRAHRRRIQLTLRP